MKEFTRDIKNACDCIDLNTACKYLPLSRRQMAEMCSRGIFKTAFKPGIGGKTSKWMVHRAEIIQHKLNAHLTAEYFYG